jgi:hypothetical protein
MITALVLAASLASCSWDRPGADRFTGDPVKAVADYDLPEDMLAKLQAKVKAHAYDDIAEITRDKIVGKHGYEDLRDMHFGANRICHMVTRDKWASTAVERGLVYCVDGQCIIVPTVCGNVSRITRIKKMVPPAGTAGGPSGGDSRVAAPPLFLAPPVMPAEVIPLPPAPSFASYQEPSYWHTVPPYQAQTYGMGNPGYVTYVPVAQIPTVPEPSTLWLMLAGLAALVISNRK